MNATLVAPSSTRWGASYVKPLVALVWLAWAYCLFHGYVLGVVDGSSHIPLWGRMGSSALLVVAGVIFAVGAVGLGRKIAALIAAGMGLGLLGDLFNAGLMPDFGFEPVIGAIITFGLGHICYITAAVWFARAVGFRDARKRLLAIAAFQLIGVVGWYFAAYLGKPGSPVVWAALPYTLLLAGTAGITAWLAAEDRRLVPLALGGTLFFVSDLILAVRMFHGEFAWAGDAVWLCYGPGQMLIVYALAAMLPILAERAAAAGHSA